MTAIFLTFLALAPISPTYAAKRCHVVVPEATSPIDPNAQREVLRLVRSQLQAFESTRKNEVVLTPEALSQCSNLRSYGLNGVEIEALLTRQLAPLELVTWKEARGIRGALSAKLLLETKRSSPSPSPEPPANPSSAPPIGRSKPKTETEIASAQAEVREMIQRQLARYETFMASWKSLEPAELSPTAGQYEKDLYQLQRFRYEETAFLEGAIQWEREKEALDPEWFGNAFVVCSNARFVSQFKLSPGAIAEVVESLPAPRRDLWNQLQNRKEHWGLRKTFSYPRIEAGASLLEEIAVHRQQRGYENRIRIRTNLELARQFLSEDIQQWGEAKTTNEVLASITTRLPMEITNYRKRILNTQKFWR